MEPLFLERENAREKYDFSHKRGFQLVIHGLCFVVHLQLFTNMLFKKYPVDRLPSSEPSNTKSARFPGRTGFSGRRSEIALSSVKLILWGL